MPPFAQLSKKDGLLIHSSILLSTYCVPGTISKLWGYSGELDRGLAYIRVGETVSKSTT